MRNELSLYPRGFFGAHRREILQHHVGKKRSEDGLAITQVQNTFQLVKFESDDDIRGSSIIDSIWKSYLGDAKNTLTLDFEEEVYKAALNAFGVTNFLYWVKAQYSSPTFGILHSDFIDDMLRFILTGERNIASITWNTMIEPGDRKIHNVPAPSEMLSRFKKEFIGTACHSTYVENDEVKAFIAIPTIVEAWCAHQGGYDDMIITLNTLFGTPK